MAEEKNKKDDIYWRVLNCALELEFKKGHLKWTMTELSRKSKITRSLIYYYFGRSKMDILQAAVSIIGEEFIGVGGRRIELWMKGEFEQSLTEARALYDKMPYLCAFYLNYRERPNDIGYELDKIDKAFKRKLKQMAPKATKEQINTIFAVYFGIGYSPYVGKAEISIFCGFIQDIFKKLR
ncbi:MAG: TetR/AcrR family transcriptional regulator [Pseudomonadota bacterium]